jgi:hypothetical protein
MSLYIRGRLLVSFRPLAGNANIGEIRVEALLRSKEALLLPANPWPAQPEHTTGEAGEAPMRDPVERGQENQRKRLDGKQWRRRARHHLGDERRKRK